jgi:hypothetical protein
LPQSSGLDAVAPGAGAAASEGLSLLGHRLEQRVALAALLVIARGVDPQIRAPPVSSTSDPGDRGARSVTSGAR